MIPDHSGGRLLTLSMHRFGTRVQSPTPAALARLLRALADVLDGEDEC